MAYRQSFSVTAVKIVTPDGKINTFPDGKDITIVTQGAVIYQVPSLFGAGTDALIVTAEGFQVTTQQEWSDLNTAISATASTGS